jgi:hypothetical protein
MRGNVPSSRRIVILAASFMGGLVTVVLNPRGGETYSSRCNYCAVR